MICNCKSSYDLTHQRRNLAFKKISLRMEKKPSRIEDLSAEVCRLQKRVAKLECHQRKNAEYELALQQGEKYLATGNVNVFRRSH